jgi:hydrogenase maturation protein HypF
MAEHGLSGPVVGVACDGTGYGSDGGIWGGEILVSDLAGFTRAAHLTPFSLPGGDAAARDTWRPAMGLLREAWPMDWTRHLGGLARLAGSGPLDLVAGRLDKGRGSVPCTSMGRLFDAVAALLGYCGRNRFEAEAAMILQHAAESAEAPPLPYALLAPEREGDPWILDVRPLLRALGAGGNPEALARGFHEAVAALLAEGAAKVASGAGLSQVVLSGGCFANGLLLRLTARRLRDAGLQVFMHRQVPCGDGGLALGQAVVAAQACLVP